MSRHVSLRMATLATLATAALCAVACSGRTPGPDGAPVASASDAGPVGCDDYRALPRLGVVDNVVDDATTERVLQWRTGVEQERMLAEMSPSLASKSLRLEQRHLASGCADLDAVVDVGRALFNHTWTVNEGWGNAVDGAPAKLRRVQQGKFGGPDALSCQSCHWKAGAAGAGDRADDAYFLGDGDDVDSADARNPPALWGAGWVEIAAREISADIQAQAAGVKKLAGFQGTPVTRPLSSKGISFGAVTAIPDGHGGAALDTSAVVGVDPDLVVKPFGWKGTFTTLREFVGASLQLHLGLQAEEVLSGASAASAHVELGGGSADDPDKDGVKREITEGQLSALVLYLATLDIPPLAALDEGPYREPVLFSNDVAFVSSPEFTARWIDGFALFGRTGCAQCHVPFVRVSDSRYRTTSALSNDAVVVDLATDGARPIPDKDDAGRYLVPAFSDFRRHDMGQALAARHVDNGVPVEQWLTRRLWGVARTAPYLHTGAAMTFDDAVAAHGGEAAGSSQAYFLATEDERVSLRIFLASLARAPSVRIR